MASASAAASATARIASRTARLSSEEKARKADAVRAAVAPKWASPPPSRSSENRIGRSAAADAGYQLRKRTGLARAESHVERTVEPLADPDAAADAIRIADQKLRGERRGEGAILRRLGRARRRIIGHRHGAPLPGGRGGAVEEPPDGGGGGSLIQPLGHESGLVEPRIDRLKKRFVTRGQALEPGGRALRLAGLREARREAGGGPACGPVALPGASAPTAASSRPR